MNINEYSSLKELKEMINAAINEFGEDRKFTIVAYDMISEGRIESIIESLDKSIIYLVSDIYVR